MKVRLLGPVEIQSEGCVTTFGGRRQRTVLATLALEPGHIASVARIVDNLWEGNPPATARQQVFNCVSALRRVTGRALVRAPGGYLLSISPDRVDVGLFELREAEAQRAAAAGRIAAAAGLLRSGLALWRGAPLCDVTGMAAERARLEERRLAVLEECVDLELALGRHARLAAELSAQVAAHPLRERLVGQLMTTLYRCGRTADALEVYRLTEKRLAAELGLDPSGALRRLESAILRADPALDCPAAAPAALVAAALAAPRQLPPDVPGFTGRECLLRTLSTMLPLSGAAALTMCVVTGSGGIGKTALAVHWAHRHGPRFPAGQLFIDLRGHPPGAPLPPAEALAQFLRALGVPADRVPVETAEAAALYRSLLSGRQMLVLLDNAATAGQVRPLLPGSPSCLVLVTSRHRLSGLVAQHGAYRLTVEPFRPDEAVALLAHLLGPDRVAAEPEAAAELARRCGHRPLALRFAAARLRDQPHRRIRDEVAQAGRRRPAAVPGCERHPAATGLDLPGGPPAPAPPRLFRSLGVVADRDADAANESTQHVHSVL